MRFRLVYSGSLRSAGNSPKPGDARDIRDHFHNQLGFLWDTHRALDQLRWAAQVPGPDGWANYMGTVQSPFRPSGPPPEAQEGFVDLTDPIQVGGVSMLPLVRKSLDLNCSLKILFLRKEDPGALVLQGGDLDGRIKTLFDALRMPSEQEQRDYPTRHTGILCCLMESDTLVSHVDVETDRLLLPVTTAPNEVQLIIEVSINVLVVGEWNVCLVGG